MFEIENDIPIPTHPNASIILKNEIVITLGKLEVGQSILVNVPALSRRGEPRKATGVNYTSGYCRAAKRGNGKNFTARRIDPTSIRVWRTR